ncbi:MAG TPA: hypothetical protein VHL80_19430 [Polyangia bacterium]|nr:hypothetical protein [Polyangia bacterium]
MTPRPFARPLAAAVLVAVAVALAAPFARAASSEPAAASTSGGFAPAADAAAAFGVTGQLALSLGATGGGYLSVLKHGDWSLQLAPSADYFFFPHVSVGGLVAYGHDSGAGGVRTSGVGSDTFSIGARAGYAFAFDDRFGVWPLVGLRLDYLAENHGSQTDTFLPIYAPALFHPAPHFFVGAGPRVDVHLSGHESTLWGIDTVLGGWF